MIDALLDLPAHLRKRLASALESGLLAAPYSAASLRSVLGMSGGRRGRRRGAASSSSDWGSPGRLPRPGFGRVEEATSRTPRPDLVWSGPEVPGLHARDTRRVYEELLGSAERSVWASTYAFFDGPRAFEVLARRMDARPELRVTLLLNIQRKRGDTTAADQLVRRFADRFWTTDWPGSSRPSVYLRPARARAGRPGGRPARQGRRRRRRGGLRDLGEPHRGRPRSQHRAGPARSRSRAGRERVDATSGG